MPSRGMVRLVCALAVALASGALAQQKTPKLFKVVTVKDENDTLRIEPYNAAPAKIMPLE
jgi:hypothetical protein